MKFSKTNRLLHNWVSIVIAIPLSVVIGSGILLLLKKELDWIQPPTQRGSGTEPALSFDDILAIAQTIPEAAIENWKDIDRLDLRPGKGMLKLQARNRWEIQMDTRSGEVLQVAYRRSDLIEGIHDGSYFHDGMKLRVFLPSAVLLAVMWATGMYLFAKPRLVKWKKKKGKPVRQANPTGVA